MPTKEDRKALAQLRKQMHASLNLDEIQELSFDLGVDYEELGEGLRKSARIRELIKYMQRENRLADLLDWLREQRPNSEWYGGAEVAPAEEGDEETGSSSHRHNVPTLPPHFVARTRATNKLRDTVFTLKKESTNDEADSFQRNRIIVVQGMGGIGKSVFASVLAWDEEVHKTFSDGIFWLSMGQTPKLETRQKQLANSLDSNTQHTFQDVQEGRAELEHLLERKHCLIILDDIWELNHATAFDALSESQSILLITTRNTTIADSLGALPYKVNLLTEKLGLSLLYQAADIKLPRNAPTDREALAVVKECGYLPLALAMIGGMVRGRPKPWNRALRRLQKADLSRIKETFPHYPYPDLLRAIQVSVEALNETSPKLNPVDRYLDLAVFPKDTKIPITTLEMLWELAGLDEIDTEDLVDAFVSRSLAQRDEDGNFQLHDLQVIYVRQNAGDLAKRHDDLLEAYADQADGLWADGPNDGYFFEHLAIHLIAAERDDELVELLQELDWITAKLSATDVIPLLADYELTLNTLTEMDDEHKQLLQLLHGTLRLSSHVLIKDKTALVTQFLGRLSDEAGPKIAELHKTAVSQQDDIWLRPLTTSLTQPGGPLHQTMRLHTGAINSINFTPDGQHLLVALDDGTIRVWHFAKEVEVAVLKGHERAVNCVIPSADGQYAFSASSDTTIIMWDLAAASVVKTFTGHTRTVNWVAPTPNGRRLLSAANDKTIKVWDIGTGTETYTLTKHRGPVKIVVATPDGKLALSGSEDRRIRTWDLSAGQPKFAPYRHNAWVNDIVITSDGNYAVSASDDNTVRIWDIVSRKEEAILRGHTSWVNALTLTIDDKLILSGSQDGTIRVWDVTDKIELATIQGHTGGITDVLVTDDGRFALSSAADGTVNVWNLEQVAEMTARTGHSGNIRAIITAGTQAFTASDDGTIKVWDVTTGQETATLTGHKAPVTDITLIPNTDLLLSISDDETIKLWQRDTWELVNSFDQACQTVAHTHDGQKIILGTGSMCTILTLPDMTEVATLKWHGGTVNSIVVTDDDSQVITVANDKKIKVWDLETAEELMAWRAHKARITKVLTTDGEYAITADQKGIIKLWLIEEESEELYVDDHQDAINDLAVTEDGDFLISASNDRTLRVWDRMEEINIATFYADSEVLACAVAADGTIIAGCVNGRIHFLRLENV